MRRETRWRVSDVTRSSRVKLAWSFSTSQVHVVAQSGYRRACVRACMCVTWLFDEFRPFEVWLVDSNRFSSVAAADWKWSSGPVHRVSNGRFSSDSSNTSRKHVRRTWNRRGKLLPASLDNDRQWSALPVDWRHPFLTSLTDVSYRIWGHLEVCSYRDRHGLLVRYVLRWRQSAVANGLKSENAHKSCKLCCLILHCSMLPPQKFVLFQPIIVLLLISIWWYCPRESPCCGLQTCSKWIEKNKIRWRAPTVYATPIMTRSALHIVQRPCWCRPTPCVKPTPH